MKVFKYRLYLLCLVLLSPVLHADYYVEISPAYMNVDTTSGTTKPWLADFRFGFSKADQQFELAMMSAIRDGELNRLSVDVPSSFSLLYHYLPDIEGTLKVHFIAGISQVKIDSSYADITDSSDTFSGLSYGLGLEESFSSIPQLKMTLDWIQLYRGEQININTTSLGIHYEF